MDISQIIIIIVTIISLFDFLVFCGLFLTFIINVTINANDTSTKIMSCIMITFFVIFKLLHIPVFLNIIEIPDFEFPYTDIIFGFLTWVNLILAAIPLFFGVYSSLIKSTPNVQNFTFNDTIFICMPIYNEKPEALWLAVKSVYNLKYSKKNLHLMLSFDDSGTPEAFLYLLQQYNLMHCIDLPIINIIDNGLVISIIRTPHAGKKSAQQAAYKAIKSFYTKNILDSAYIFFIDSDIVLDKYALAHFMFHMKTYNTTALTGTISCLSKKRDFLTYYQDVEYISGQILTRNLENVFGSVLCLSGCVTIIKFNSFKNITNKYFGKNIYNSLFEHSREYLGEDRMATDMLMQNGEKLGYCQYAKCKTECPDTLKNTIKQRGRWYKGSISNDVWTLSSVYTWKNYTLLSLFSFLNNTRNTSIYIYLLYFILLINNNVSVILWILFIILPILLLWLFISIHAIKINRKMNILFYPMLLIFQPILSMIYMYYTIYTLNKRSWEGIRVDKEKEQKILEKV
jgi:cellulose synthase/poly-beta-1,6-N-acetylglucosamine synthase-like glycosyltransferase